MQQAIDTIAQYLSLDTQVVSLGFLLLGGGCVHLEQDAPEPGK